MLDKIKLSLQHILPRQGITRLAGWGASKRAGWLTKMAVNLFVKYYKVNMQEAHNADIASYQTFNAFFARPLRDGARPIDNDPNTLVMPADGVISQSGPIDDDRLLQAKGHSYTLEALLAGNYPMAALFRGGTFATTYLSPRDYHRVHMPCNGILREMIYIPGDLFSVNPLTAQNIPNLFARNERVICQFDTEFGPMAQILVGATIVGSIETLWAGTITPPRTGIIKRWTWPAGDQEGCIALLKGQEMGRFKLGSTVINLFAPGKVTLLPDLQHSSVARLGEVLGRMKGPAQAVNPQVPEAVVCTDTVTPAEPAVVDVLPKNVTQTFKPSDSHSIVQSAVTESEPPLTDGLSKASFVNDSPENDAALTNRSQNNGQKDV